MSKMAKIVKECIDKYVGGNKYFDEMDDRIKYDEEILEELVEDMYCFGRVLILSGQFGRQMVSYLKEKHRYIDYILLVGSPRKMEKVTIKDIRLENFNVKLREAVFVDDTFFSGRTFFYCKGVVEATFGLQVNHAIVAYDGGKHEQSYLESLYRYYDYYDINGKPY